MVLAQSATEPLGVTPWVGLLCSPSLKFSPAAAEPQSSGWHSRTCLPGPADGVSFAQLVLLRAPVGTEGGAVVSWQQTRVGPQGYDNQWGGHSTGK